jgi:hypothetical protein
MRTSTKTIRLAGNDPILREILERGPRRFGLVFSVILIAGIVPLLRSWQDGNFVNPTLHLDAAHDFGYFNQFLLLLPFIVGFTRYYLKGLEPALRTLQERRVVKMSPADFDRFALKANRVFANSLVTWVPYVAGAAVVLFAYFAFVGAGENTWNSPPRNTPLTPVAWMTMLDIFLLYFTLGALVIRIGVIYKIIRLFLSQANEVVINPLHPDKCGGLSPLGDFSLRITLAGLLAGICVVVGVTTNIYQHGHRFWSAANCIMVIGYVFGLSVVFFLPLLAARRGMLEAKQETLQKIGDHCNEEFRKAINGLNAGENPKIENMEQIEHLNKLYAVADRMPVYPFNTENVVRFASSVVWPILLMGLTWIKEHFK